MAHKVRILTETQLRAALGLDTALVDTIQQAFVALASGKVIMPPILSMDMEAVNAEVDVKTAYIPGFDGFAIKVSPGFFDNPKLGLPSLNGLMVLLSAKTGLVEAVYLDNGYLTDLRTAAAGAVAARHLAPAKVETLGVMGTGVQARLQAKAAYLERPFQRLLVWGRDPAKAQACATELAASLDLAQAEAVSDPAQVVADSQLVITTTPARTPIIQADWLHPGLHITAMGSDQAGKNELAPSVLQRADLYVCDSLSQCDVSGELEAARAAGILTDTTPPELGMIIAGQHPGRQSQQDITVCDLTGTGAQDTAIASYALSRLGKAGLMIET